MDFAASVQRKSLVLVALLATLPGCQALVPPPDPPVYQGVQLRVACPPGLAELVRTQSRVWQSRQEAGVEPVEYGPATGPAGLAGADVWVIPTADLPYHVAAGEVVALPEDPFTRRGSSFEWSSLLPAYREQLLLWESKPFAVPLVGEAPVCVYRADLYADLAVQAKYRAFQKGRGPIRELRPPVTWQEFASQAEFFQSHHPSGKGPSLPPLPASVEALDRLFYSVAASYARRAVLPDEHRRADYRQELFAFHYDLSDQCEPRIATEGFVEALELLIRLQKCRPSGNSARPEEAFLKGQALLCVTDASWLVAFQKEPRLRDRFGICAVPGSDRYFTASRGWVQLKDTSNHIPYLGGSGWLACVPKKAKHAEAALDLLADLAGPARSSQAALEPVRGAGPTRTPHLLRERWDSYDLDRSRTGALKEVLGKALLQHNLRNPALCLRIPDQASHRAALVAGLRKALADGGKASEVLQGVARQWKELDARKGLKQHRIDYLRSVGLQQ
jgi:hypothetical protein